MQNWRLRHVGIIVKDIAAATSYYESIGFPPLGPELLLHGSGEHQLKARFIDFGPLELELIESPAATGLQADFMACHGDGVQHLAFTVDDLTAETVKLAARGIPMLFDAELPNGFRLAYFDTGGVADMMIELVQPAKE
jgi:methylmalonyl-CoA/ethylmalonyl-CoA epimerase